MTASPPLARTPPARWPWLFWLGVIGVLLLVGYSLWRYGGVDTGPRWGLRGANLGHALAYTTIGALILTRHPWHRVGLIMLWVGASSTLQSALEEFAAYGLFVAPAALPGALFAAWVSNWMWLPGIGAGVALLPLFFPDGRLVSPRWRAVVALSIIGMFFAVLGFGLTPGPFGSSFGTFDNPYGLTRFGAASATVTGVAVGVGLALLFAGIILAAVSLLWRLRRAVGVERQQLKWIVYAGLLSTALTPLTASNLPLLHMFYIVASTALPLAIGLAVLRYRLYDIDLIVNRALVYGALTTVLAGVYFGSVVLLQSLFAALTGESRSALVTVLSTLAIAALFTPVRARLQSFIDRRFYRRKYDAARTLAAFGATMRDDVDLATLSGRLLAVVDETMQPAEAALWLKSPDET